MSIIRTNQIQDTSGNSAMMINSSGVVTFPNAPFYAFAARKKLASGAGDTGATGIIVFNNIQSNIGNAYSGADGRFTAPVAGTYSFSFFGLACQASGAAHTGSTGTTGFFYKNGSDSGYGRIQVTNVAGYSNIAATAVITLAINDYIQIFIESGAVLSAEVANYNHFNGHLVGV